MDTQEYDVLKQEIDNLKAEVNFLRHQNSQMIMAIDHVRSSVNRLRAGM